MLQTSLEHSQQTRPYEKAIRQFGEILLNDPPLLAQLDTAPDKESFIRLYIRLAADRNCRFSAEQLEVAVQEQKQGSNWIIPKVVLRMIADRF